MAHPQTNCLEVKGINEKGIMISISSVLIKHQRLQSRVLFGFYAKPVWKKQRKRRVKAKKLKLKQSMGMAYSRKYRYEFQFSKILNKNLGSNLSPHFTSPLSCRKPRGRIATFLLSEHVIHFFVSITAVTLSFLSALFSLHISKPNCFSKT